MARDADPDVRTEEDEDAAHGLGGERADPGLVAVALSLLEEGGILICSSNHQKVDTPEYLKELRRGALQAGSGLQVISLAGQPEDFPCPVTFPEGRYLKYATCVKRSEP